jgi:hypothetical protein
MRLRALLLAAALCWGCGPHTNPHPSTIVGYSADIFALFSQAETNGSTTVELSSGTWVIDKSLGFNGDSHWTFVGQGRGKTILQAAAGLQFHVLHLANVEDWNIGGMTIDGNFPNNTLGHCFRGAWIDGVNLHDFELRNCAGYGAGFQNGYIRNLTLERGWITNTNVDGIDFKNRENANENIVLRNLTIHNPSAGGQLNKAGVDIRGPIEGYNITITGVPLGNIGYRFRHGEAGETNGAGGHEGLLDGFSVECVGYSGSIGVDSVARQTEILNGEISGCANGVLVNPQVGNDYTQVAGVTCQNCGNGFVTRTKAFGTVFEETYAYDSLTDGYRIEGSGVRIRYSEANNSGRYGVYLLNGPADIRILNSFLTDNPTGVLISPGSTGIILSGNHFSGNGQDVVDQR